MTKIKATIERTPSGTYSVVGDKVVSGCYFAGYGESVQEAKEDFMAGIAESLETAAEMGKDNGVSAEDVKVEFRYDLPSFFNEFDWINVSAFAKLAGINESKMRAYKSGAATPSERTLKKIAAAVRTIADSLSAASL